MFEYKVPIRVRYADTDQMGYVYYGNYARYFEIGRVESLRSLGISYKALEEKGIMMPVLENYSKYIRPAFYDNLLTITVMVKEIPGTRIRFDYEIHNEEGTLIHVGFTVLVFISSDTKKIIPFPEYIKEAIEKFF